MAYKSGKSQEICIYEGLVFHVRLETYSNKKLIRRNLRFNFICEFSDFYAR